MATGTTTSGGAAGLAQQSEQARYIEGQLKKTETYVKMVDWLTSLAVLAIGVAVYLLLFALLDHWVFVGGLSFLGRAFAWFLLTVAVCVYCWRQLAPLVLQKVSPIYVADAIEHAEPTLKNSLVNFLMLRHNSIGVHRLVFQGVEQQAAARLSGVPVESSIDMSRLIRIGYLLAGVLALCVLYKVVSPKDPFVSAYRAMIPWADVEAPSRVTIANVAPGDSRQPLGSQVQIEAQVDGLGDDEPVTLYYSTADKQVVDKPLRMFVGQGGGAHTALLPESTAGLGQDVTYRIEAGDARTKTYQLQAIASPAIVVKNIEYRYPSYTGLGTRTVERIGHVKAIEGTEVIVRAEANQNIESASIELDGPRAHSVAMSSKETSARGGFTLRMKSDGARRIPLLESYRLRFRAADGGRNQDPIRHQIEIIPDQPPRVEILSPERTELRVPLDGELEFVVRGSDSDFAVGELKLTGRKGMDVVVDHDLLAPYQPPYGESYREKYRFRPQSLGLQEGDVVRIQATVKDNKRPQPNMDETVEYLVTIDPPETLAPQDQQQQGEPQNQQQGQG
ncbi:MAG: hypothetical protein WEA31_03660, partial [Pirellulales bacterium]